MTGGNESTFRWIAWTVIVLAAADILITPVQLRIQPVSVGTAAPTFAVMPLLFQGEGQGSAQQRSGVHSPEAPAVAAVRSDRRPRAPTRGGIDRRARTLRL